MAIIGIIIITDYTLAKESDMGDMDSDKYSDKKIDIYRNNNNWPYSRQGKWHGWHGWIVTGIVTRKLTIIEITTTDHTLANLRSDLQQEQQLGEALMIQNPKPVTYNSIYVSSMLIFRCASIFWFQVVSHSVIHLFQIFQHIQDDQW